MKSIFRVIALLAAVGVVSVAEAKTSKYELINIHSVNGWITFPGLEFNNATSAILTVTKNPPSPEAKIVSLEVFFPKAAKLTATNFKLIDGGRYRALVSGAWVYKEIIIDINTFNIDWPLNVEAFVSDRTAYINPIAEGQNPTASIFHLDGMLNDISPTRIVDQEILTLAGKKLTLSLKDRLLFQAQPRAEGFVVDSLWYGKGAKTLFIPAPVPRDQFDTIDAIALIISGNASDPLVSVKFKDFLGTEMQGPQTRLRDLLDQAYGPTQWPM